MHDDGHYAVPAELLGQLGKGPAVFMLYRHFVDYFALPSGAAVETVGQAFNDCRVTAKGQVRAVLLSCTDRYYETWVPCQ